MTPPYPSQPGARDRWVRSLRGARAPADPWRPNGFFVEEERADSGELVTVSTVLLANRECPWRCVMCDLWRHTLPTTAPAGAIPTQIDHALRRLPATRQIKLYNSGSFFDPKAISPAEFSAIARRVRRFERVIVECHPALVNDSAARFRDLIGTQLEVAMGLETAHPEALARLNKRMTVAQFARAAAFLRQRGMAVRAFVLVNAPFLAKAETAEWTRRSVNFAFDSGAGVVTLIPTRAGNGAMDALAAAGEFSKPGLSALEEALDYGIDSFGGAGGSAGRPGPLNGNGARRVFADLWDLERFSGCAACFAPRRERLAAINREQTPLPRVHCDCGCS